MRTGILIAAAALLAGAAHAQEPESKLALSLLNESNKCTELPDTGNSFGAVSACQQALIAIDALTASAAAPLNAHESNMALFARANVQSRIGLEYGRMDGARSARVCTQVETSWTLLAQVKPDLSPDFYRQPLRDLQVGAAPAVRQCRVEKGTPAGATPLP
jgi:hypothetical protein